MDYEYVFALMVTRFAYDIYKLGTDAIFLTATCQSCVCAIQTDVEKKALKALKWQGHRAC